MDGIVNGEVIVLTDSGWFPLDRTRMPSTQDLVLLQKNVSMGDLDPPEHWASIADATVVQRHVLKKDDPECKEVEKAFLRTMSGPRFQGLVIHKVERIQNFALWQTYIIKRQVGWRTCSGLFLNLLGCHPCHTHPMFAVGCVLDNLLP